MPVISSTYAPPFVFKSNHFATLYSGLLRTVEGVEYQRERITLPDDDFIDLDWSYASKKTKKLVVLLHGLEGSANRPYILGSAKAFNNNNIDACAINLRSCSGIQNNLYRSYHSGATEDLETVLKHIITSKSYDTIILKGFSLGGNITLKYLGTAKNIPEQIKAAIAVSVPCFLYGSMLELHKYNNLLYKIKFKRNLLEKLRQKQQLFPDKISDSEINQIKTLKDFDDIYTSKAHGFDNALDYYEKSSSLPHLKNIDIPTLLINAKNDSFLSPECYPICIAEKNKNLFLEMPNYGGHVGFFDKKNVHHNEKRAISFINQTLN